MKPFLLALLTGLLFAFSLPPFNQEWLGWFTFAPLLIAASGRRPLEAVGLGMIAGAASGFAQAGWHHDTTRLFWAYIPFLWLTFLFGFVALAASRVPAVWNPAFRVLFLASVGISGEWLTSFLPLPLNIGLSQYKNLPLIQIAQWTGIWGVSFLLWWVNAALVEVSLRRKYAPLGIGVGLVALTLAYSLWVLEPGARSPVRRQTARRGDPRPDFGRDRGPGDGQRRNRPRGADEAGGGAWGKTHCLVGRIARRRVFA